MRKRENKSAKRENIRRQNKETDKPDQTVSTRDKLIKLKTTKEATKASEIRKRRQNCSYQTLALTVVDL